MIAFCGYLLVSIVQICEIESKPIINNGYHNMRVVTKETDIPGETSIARATLDEPTACPFELQTKYMFN